MWPITYLEIATTSPNRSWRVWRWHSWRLGFCLNLTSHWRQLYHGLLRHRAIGHNNPPAVIGPQHGEAQRDIFNRARLAFCLRRGRYHQTIPTAERLIQHQADAGDQIAQRRLRRKAGLVSKRP